MADRRSTPCKVIEPHVSFLERLGNDAWLLALLANLDDSDKDHLVDCLHNLANMPMTEYEASGEDKVQFKRLKKRTVAPGPIGTVANLYALAVLAHQYGHPEFIVADDLTRRQMNPTIASGYNIGPSDVRNVNFEVILVSVFDEDVTSTTLYVWARRVGIGSDGRVRQWGEWPGHEGFSIAQMFAESHEAWKAQAIAAPGETRLLGGHSGRRERNTPSGAKFEDQIWTHYGLGIQDPDCSILTPGAVRTLGRKSRLTAQRNTIGKMLPCFPTELVYNIVDLLEVSTPVQLPIWRTPPRERHLVIFVSFSMTPKQRQEIEHEIRMEVSSGDDTLNESTSRLDSQITFELIPLERHGATSRRDFMRLWAEYFPSTVMFQKRNHLPPLHILSEPIIDNRYPHFIEILGDNKSVALATRKSLSLIVEITRECGNDPEDRWSEIHSPAEVALGENLCQPEQPFYRTRFSWQSPTTFHTKDNWVPIFYLTSQLTDDQDLQIRREIVIPEHPHYEYGDIESELKGCGFAPWPKGKPDGTIRDIWNIAQHVHKESLWRDDEYFFCIDQQTAIDKKFILVIPDHRKVRNRWHHVKDMDLPDLAGFTYTRISCCRAYGVCLAIQFFGKKNLRDFERERFLRPELLRVDRMKKNDEYPYVDVDGKRLEMMDVDSEASPSLSVSSSEGEEDEGVLRPTFIH